MQSGVCVCAATARCSFHAETTVACVPADTDDEEDSDDEVDSELEEDDKAVESDEEAPVPATAEEAEFQKRFDEIAEKVRGHAWCRRLVCPCCGLPFG